MKRWPTKTLGELLKVHNGFAFKSGLFNEDGKGLPIVRIRDLARGFSETFYNGEHDSAYEVKNGDFLIGMDGEFRCYNWQGGRALLNQRVCRLQDFSHELHAGYVFYGINEHLQNIEANTAFVTVKHLSSKQIASIEMVVPPLEEQERIVKLLDQADELRKLRAQADRRTTALIPALFHEMFGDPTRNGSQWPVLKLGELAADTRNGINPTKSQFGSGVPFVTVNNLYDGLEIKTDKLQQVAISEDEEAKYKLLPGDICFVRSSVKREGIGMSSIFAASSPAVFGGFVIRVRTKPELNPVFACSFFLLPSTRKRIVDAANSGTITNISQPSLLRLELPVPPLPLQKEFAQRVTEIRALVAAQAASRCRVGDLFQSMLHCAFNGEL